MLSEEEESPADNGKREELRAVYLLGLLAVLVSLRFQNEQLLVPYGQEEIDLIPWIDITIILWFFYALFMLLALSKDVVGETLAQTFRFLSKLFLVYDYALLAFIGTLFFYAGYPTRAPWILGLVAFCLALGVTIEIFGKLWDLKKAKPSFTIWTRLRKEPFQTLSTASLLIWIVFAVLIFLHPDDSYLFPFFCWAVASFVVSLIARTRISK
jgi:hypothetical protein